MTSPVFTPGTKGRQPVDRKHLASVVKKTRLAKRLSMEEAARQARISAITWKRVEDGLRVQDDKLTAVLAVIELAAHAPKAPNRGPELPYTEARKLVNHVQALCYAVDLSLDDAPILLDQAARHAIDAAKLLQESAAALRLEPLS